jgi:hypothetical protein
MGRRGLKWGRIGFLNLVSLVRSQAGVQYKKRLYCAKNGDLIKGIEVRPFFAFTPFLPTLARISRYFTHHLPMIFFQVADDLRKFCTYVPRRLSYPLAALWATGRR